VRRRACRHADQRAAPQQPADPATTGTGRDNNTFWVPDFSADHYHRLLFTEEGVQQRVRTDLKGPDGKPGVDIRGLTVRNLYDEMSKGAYTLTGSCRAGCRLATPRPGTARRRAAARRWATSAIR
jgi:immune inhibitor A